MKIHDPGRGSDFRETWDVSCRETFLHGSVAFLHICEKAPRLFSFCTMISMMFVQPPALEERDSISLWSRGQTSLLPMMKDSEPLSSGLPSCNIILLVCTQPSGPICASPWDLGARETLECADALDACCAVSNQVFCLWPTSIVFSASIRLTCSLISKIKSWTLHSWWERGPKEQGFWLISSCCGVSDLTSGLQNSAFPEECFLNKCNAHTETHTERQRASCKPQIGHRLHEKVGHFLVHSNA